MGAMDAARELIRMTADGHRDVTRHSSQASLVTAEVQDFYERYPYPRPIDDLEEYRQLWQDPQRRRADFHLFWPTRRYREDFSILIAGCGTSQAAKYALRWPQARVTGIDFSATSVRCTEELKRKYNLHNLSVHQLSVERTGELETMFDQVVSTGVLHHLPDPDAGLGALRSVLKPDGAMHLMVYAPYGRAGIYMLREFCRRTGIQATDEGIREVITALGSLPPTHPLCTLLRESPDSRNEAMLADALLHPQERAYSIPELFDFIGSNGLCFNRWLTQAPYNPQCGVMNRIPQFSRPAQLSLAVQYAAVELLRGTMVRHSVIVNHHRAAGTCQVSFDGDVFLGYVPIRMPDAICVQERLPPGAAGVLINRKHTYTDLYLPVNARELRMFHAIDGERTVGEIVREVESTDMARTFFERLWWMDQIVFDAHGLP
jgi:SAM-dependent methyltransferase